MAGIQKPEIVTQDGVTIVAFGPAFEKISEDVIPAVSDALLLAAGGDNSRVVVDLSHTQFFGSSFIEALFRGWNKLKTRPEPMFVLCGLTSYCLEVLEVTNLNRLWPIYPDRESAVAALKKAA